MGKHNLQREREESGQIGERRKERASFIYLILTTSNHVYIKLCINSPPLHIYITYNIYVTRG